MLSKMAHGKEKYYLLYDLKYHALSDLCIITVHSTLGCNKQGPQMYFAHQSLPIPVSGLCFKKMKVKVTAVIAELIQKLVVVNNA